MQIVVNSEPRESAATTLDQLLSEISVSARHVAVAVNGAVIPKHLHNQFAVQTGDRVEIVHPVGGG